MRRTTIALASVLVLSTSAALAGSDNKDEGNGGQWGGSPLGPMRNLMTSGINPVYHPWMIYGRGPVASRAHRAYGSGAYGYAGNAYASAARPRVHRLGSPGTFGYGFGTHEEEDPPGLLPVPRR
jgi:hypothetical protein